MVMLWIEQRRECLGPVVLLLGSLPSLVNISLPSAMSTIIITTDIETDTDTTTSTATKKRKKIKRKSR